MSQRRRSGEGADLDVLAEVPDGAGCVEIWERLSERRADSDD